VPEDHLDFLDDEWRLFRQFKGLSQTTSFVKKGQFSMHNPGLLEITEWER